MNWRMTDWFKAAQKIKVGQRIRMPHDGCSIGDALLVTRKREGISAHCFLCKQSMFVPAESLSLGEMTAHMRSQLAQDAAIEKIRALPQPQQHDVREWPLDARVWLYKAGLSNDDIEKLGIYFHEPTQRVVVPVRDNGSLVYWQARAAVPGPGRPKYLNPAAGRRDRLVAYWAGADEELVICEDFLSAYRVASATECCSMALLGTDVSDAILSRILSKHPRVAIWLDSDKAGRTASAKIQQKLKLYDIPYRDILTERDPKLHSNQEIRDALRP